MCEILDLLVSGTLGKLALSQLLFNDLSESIYYSSQLFNSGSHSDRAVYFFTQARVSLKEHAYAKFGFSISFVGGILLGVRGLE